jgi:hypothetical protein
VRQRRDVRREELVAARAAGHEEPARPIGRRWRAIAQQPASRGEERQAGVDREALGKAARGLVEHHVGALGHATEQSVREPWKRVRFDDRRVQAEAACGEQRAARPVAARADDEPDAKALQQPSAPVKVGATRRAPMTRAAGLTRTSGVAGRMWRE